ncbi:amino acid/polyamine/organocation transporter, APC superfamily [Sphingomonas guangdongensis]|uniref:Amino acid/polyamine/organocation transporter, APC superfamily n=2 Tax=Sphingomonas guangdongensis TaxID=1141890 RepID=A0A285QGN9_9SPHN|nr:amino acid/polyamine/organocation transporter, APC superfamily [Sphingomonas guangdongensis]
MASGMFRRKAIVPPSEMAAEHQLARTLSWPHLVALGVGAIVGTGILTLIGVGADRAGPAVIVSFAVAGLICACAALAYAEMATMMPVSGSAYTYSYAVLGEVFAWVVGWSLLAEYTLVVATVAVGWSGYATGFLAGLGLALPDALTHGPTMADGAVASWGVNVPALVIVAVVAGLLMLGTKESATLNAVLVVVKVIALAVFVGVALPYFDGARLEPFSPFGFAKHLSADGVERGVMAAAAIIFFAFYGFDAISTAAEETKNPGRDLAIGIVGSMAACVAIYMIVAVAAVGALSYTRFADSPEPLALILREIGQPGAARFLAGSAVIALPTVILAFLYGQSRIFFVMARDRLLPESLARVSARGTPVRITLFTAAIVMLFAGFLPIDAIAALANAGTLTAFAAVAVCMLVMRRRAPDMARPFRAPAAWVVGAGAIVGCAYLFISLPSTTQLWFLGWNVVGLLLYFLFVARRQAV